MIEETHVNTYTIEVRYDGDETWTRASGDAAGWSLQAGMQAARDLVRDGGYGEREEPPIVEARLVGIDGQVIDVVGRDGR